MSGRQIFRIVGPIVVTAGAIAATVWIVGADPQRRTPLAVIEYSLAVAAALVALAGLWRLLNWSLPVREIQQVASRMARGDWTARVNPRGIDDVRAVANNLNLLGAQAQKQLADLHAQRGSLQTLVDTLPDPILAADAQGRIILLNAPAARLLQLAPAEALHQKVVNVVNDEQIVQLYESIEASHDATPATPLSRELRLTRDAQRFTYQAVATRMVGGGALLVLRDVTRLASAVQMKTDFVANASHELRTPFSAVKLAFETLREVHREDPAQSERCIAVIDGHLRRLEEMLRDLLDLSHVENAELTAHVGPVETAEVFALLKSTMGAFARQKNVELRLDDAGADTPACFNSDGRLINLVLKNLVENSIKFTPAGGKVNVSIRAVDHAAGNDGGPVNIVVADTGIGIAPEHIDRVFERFYQVEPARTGSAGRGTGLGLAIVKHAVHAMGGTVKLDSKPGAGTTVTCQVPQRPASSTAAAEVDA